MGLLSTYDPGWPARFESEAARLRNALGELALRIEHVGSTSVPGLHAKNIIDIQVSMASITPLAPLTARLEPGAMPFDTRGSTALGPAPIAVHDDGDVARHAFGAQVVLVHRRNSDSLRPGESLLPCPPSPGRSA